MFRYNPPDETAFVDAETAFGSVFDDDTSFGADDDAGIEASLQDLEDELDLDDDSFGEVREVVKQKIADTADLLKSAFVTARELAVRGAGFGGWMAVDATVDADAVFNIIKTSLGVADWVVSDNEIRELADVLKLMVEDWGYGWPEKGRDIHRLLQRLCLYETVGEQALVDDRLLDYWNERAKEWKSSAGFWKKAWVAVKGGIGTSYPLFDGLMKDFFHAAEAVHPMGERQLFNCAAGVLLIWDVLGGLEEALEALVRDWLPDGMSQKDYTVLQAVAMALVTADASGKKAIDTKPGTVHRVALRPGGTIPSEFAPEPSPDLTRVPTTTYEPSPAFDTAPYQDIPVASEGGSDYVPMILAVGIAWTMFSH